MLNVLVLLVNIVAWNGSTKIRVTENLVVNLPEVSWSYSLCPRILIGPFLFQATVTGIAYLWMLQHNIISSSKFCFWRRMMCYHITTMMWEIFSVFIFLQDGNCRGEVQCPPLSPHKTFTVGYSKENCSTWDMKLKLLRTPIHCQQYKNYATLLHIIVNVNALKLVVAILNTWDNKRSNTTID